MKNLKKAIKLLRKFNCISISDIKELTNYETHTVYYSKSQIVVTYVNLGFNDNKALCGRIEEHLITRKRFTDITYLNNLKFDRNINTVHITTF